MTYVLENIPEPLDAELRRKAAAEGKTVSQLVVEQLQQINSEAAAPVKKRDLSDIAGKWVDDPIFHEIREELERIDPNDWK